MNGPSMAKITAIDQGGWKAVASLQPLDYETGWLPTLVKVDASHSEADCLVVPCHGTYGQGLIIPFPLPTARTGVLIGLSPPTVQSGGSEYNCRSTVDLTSDDQGREVLIVPTTTDYVIVGVIK